MDVIELLRKKGGEITDQAIEAVAGARLPHYEKADPAQTRDRLKTLFDLTLECLVTKSVVPMMKHAEKIAEQRFSSAFTLRELQTAFNVLEESICGHILNEMQPNDYAAAVALISTVLRVGKESVLRTYLSHVSKSKVLSLDMLNDFAGTDVS